MTAPVPLGAGPAEGVAEAEVEAACRAFRAQPHPTSMSSTVEMRAALEAAAAARASRGAPAEGEVERLEQECLRLAQLCSDYEDVLEDKRRNTRAIDVAMHGEEGTAQQASLCDLIEPARRLRRERDEREVWADEWHRTVEVILIMADLSSALGAAEAASAMQAWMAEQSRRLAAAERGRDAAVAVLRRVEFEGSWDRCPCCLAFSPNHALNCALAIQLRGAAQGRGGQATTKAGPSASPDISDLALVSGDAGDQGAAKTDPGPARQVAVAGTLRAWCQACQCFAETGCRHPCGPDCCPHRRALAAEDRP